MAKPNLAFAGPANNATMAEYESDRISAHVAAAHAHNRKKRGFTTMGVQRGAIGSLTASASSALGSKRCLSRFASYLQPGLCHATWRASWRSGGCRRSSSSADTRGPVRGLRTGCGGWLNRRRGDLAPSVAAPARPAGQGRGHLRLELLTFENEKMARDH